MAKLAILVDGDNVEVHHEDSKTAVSVGPTGTTSVPYASDLAQMFAQQKGEPLPVNKAPPWVSQQPTQGPPAVSGTFTVVDGKHYDLPLHASQARYVFRRQVGEVAEIALHVQVPLDYVAKDSAHVGWLKVTGATSGDVHGGAAASFGAKDAPGGQPLMEGQLSSYTADFTVMGPIHAVKPGEFVNVFLRLDGGDPSIYLDVLSPNAY